MNDRIQYNPQNGFWLLCIGREQYTFSERSVPLGRGGMGAVYLGNSVRTGARVAVKKIHDKYANIPEIRTRAREEAALRFSHPNMVEMIGCAESITGCGPMFIVSNYVVGKNIDKYLEDAIPPSCGARERQRRIVEMLLPVMDALQYIHDSNICHLDIKPSNIMVESGRNVRLMDLGIALTHRLPAASSSGNNVPTGETTGSGLMGTPKYAAPEQFGPECGYGNIDSVTDIYELGVTIYELLAGVNPFVSDSIQATFNNHVNLVLPSAANVSSAMISVLRKATAPRKEDRYQTVGEMRAALIEAANKKPSLLDKIMRKN